MKGQSAMRVLEMSSTVSDKVGVSDVGVSFRV